MLLPDIQIPPGRAWATESKKHRLGMRGMASKILDSIGTDKGMLRFLTREVFEWILQTEHELRQELIERVDYLLGALQALIPAQEDPPSPRSVQILEKIDRILKAIRKIDNEGSPPLIPEA